MKLQKEMVQDIMGAMKHHGEQCEDPQLAMEYGHAYLMCKNALADPRLQVELKVNVLVPKTKSFIVNYLVELILTEEWGSDKQVKAENALYEYIEVMYNFDVETFVSTHDECDIEDALTSLLIQAHVQLEVQHG